MKLLSVDQKIQLRRDDNVYSHVWALIHILETGSWVWKHMMSWKLGLLKRSRCLQHSFSWITPRNPKTHDLAKSQQFFKKSVLKTNGFYSYCLNLFDVKEKKTNPKNPHFSSVMNGEKEVTSLKKCTQMMAEKYWSVMKISIQCSLVELEKFQ